MPSLNPALRDFWWPPDGQYYRNRVLYGGRASSKSWDAAGIAITMASLVKLRFLCTRQFQSKIAESVYTLLKIQAERLGKLHEFKFTDNSIIHLRTGSEFIFYGIARNLDEIKSLTDIDVLWLEEAHLLTREQWKIIEPTIREDGSQIWVIFNPRFVIDFAYQRFVANPPPNTIIRKINYDENPFLSQTMLDVIEAARLEDEEEFRHVYLGEPMLDDNRGVIKMSWIEAAIDAHVKLGLQPSGKMFAGLDVADEGADMCAFAGRRGILLDRVEEWSGKGADIFATVEKAFALADAMGCDDLSYDGDGLGAGVKGDGRIINERRQHEIKLHKFQGSGGVIRPDDKIPQFDGDESKDKDERTNKDYFANRKAQGWWALRMRFLRTYRAVVKGHAVADPDALISISSNIPKATRDKLCMELAQATYNESGAGKMLINKQPDGTKSPNLADSVMIAYAPREPERRGFFDI